MSRGNRIDIIKKIQRSAHEGIHEMVRHPQIEGNSICVTL